MGAPQGIVSGNKIYKVTDAVILQVGPNTAETQRWRRDKTGFKWTQKTSPKVEGRRGI